MPKLEKRLTDTVARSLPLPPPPVKGDDGRTPGGYEIHWCNDTPGFGVRVTHVGARSWIMERRVNGATKRRTLGKAAGGRSAISADAARRLMIVRSGEMEQGQDRLEIRRAQAKQKKYSITVAEAVRTFAEKSRRTVDRKEVALKSTTKADYLAAVEPGRIGKIGPNKGKPLKDGKLYAIAQRKIDALTGDEIRRLYEQLVKDRGRRQADIAMQLLRAVINYFGIKVPDTPFGTSVPKAERITVRQQGRPPKPIEPEVLGAFWCAACDLDQTKRYGPSSRVIRFVLLTGTRIGESAGSIRAGQSVDGAMVRDFNAEKGSIILHDTKNRRDHKLYLSRQALEIAKACAEGKHKGDRLFDVMDPGKTLIRICKYAGIEPRGVHELRKTFTTLGANLVPAYTLKLMVNHKDGDDVTLEHYIGSIESIMRAGWQTVADYIEARAEEFRKSKGQ